MRVQPILTTLVLLASRCLAAAPAPAAAPAAASAPRPKVLGYAAGKDRIAEKLDRGLIAVPIEGGKVYLGWRLLADDPKDIAFHVYRQIGEGASTRLTAEPAGRTTDFVDASPASAGGEGKPCAYFIRPIIGGKEGPPSPAAAPTAAPSGGFQCLTIKLQGDYAAQKVGIADLDGDGRYDLIIKQPKDNIDPYEKYWSKSPDTYKLEAYRGDGQFIWRVDLGWAIERGIWYSPYVVHDLDGDGKAEVAAKTGDGDPRDADGRVQSGPEHLSILDGLTGKTLARIDWPDRQLIPNYNRASRNQLCVAYLDGKTPCLIVERGTYDLIVVRAYEFSRPGGAAEGKLRLLWEWTNKDEPKPYWGQGAHWMHAADVDGDGRDEVVIGSAVLDDNGSALWTTGLGHPDHCYVGDLDPDRPGLEIYYGIETRRQKNGMCMVEARTGKVLWGYDGPTRHVHGQGLCSDIDPRHPGSECYSADTDADKKFAFALLHSSRGEVIGRDNVGGFGARAAWWDADAHRELLLGSRIVRYGTLGPVELRPRIQGAIIAVADIIGDWREEIITAADGELRIYTTTIPAADRRACLMQDPIYRADVTCAAMGYFQVPTLSYDLATAKPK